MLGQAPDACREFGALLDRIAIDAALRGDMAGFDGRHLEVLLHCVCGTLSGDIGGLWRGTMQVFCTLLCNAALAWQRLAAGKLARR